jgi:cyclopropane-fatty-acyl-phospholipid synthase
MNTNNIILIICIVIVTIMIIYDLLKIPFAKYSVIFILGSFDKGNFTLINSCGNEIFKVINDCEKPNPIIQLINPDNFYYKIYSYGEVGLGESYMNGDWVSNDLVGFMNSMALNMNNIKIPQLNLGNIFNTNLDYDRTNIQHHYDVGNDFYMKFLKDDLSAYTCGFWFNDTDTLTDAQYNKVNTIIKKMNTRPNKSILDIGCGWGKIANYVANRTNCIVTGITISDEQARFGFDNYNIDKVQIINIDYRLLNTQFDYIYSIGMFEHVRYENYDSFFQMIKRCLNINGRFVLHTIISFDLTNKMPIKEGSFVTKHIFPGGQIPCNDWILEKARCNGLNVVHFEGFGGQHYAKTLKVWREYMIEAKEFILQKYGLELFLKYEYYFASCEAAFNTGSLGIGHYVIVQDDVLSTTNSFNYNIENNKKYGILDVVSVNNSQTSSSTSM